MRSFESEPQRFSPSLLLVDLFDCLPLCKHASGTGWVTSASGGEVVYVFGQSAQQPGSGIQRVSRHGEQIEAHIVGPCLGFSGSPAAASVCRRPPKYVVREFMCHNCRQHRVVAEVSRISGIHSNRITVCMGIDNVAERDRQKRLSPRNREPLKFKTASPTFRPARSETIPAKTAVTNKRCLVPNRSCATS